MTLYECLWIVIAPAVLLSWYYLIKGWKTFLPRYSRMPHNPYPHRYIGKSGFNRRLTVEEFNANINVYFVVVGGENE